MLSAVIIVGACVLIVTALCGLIAIGLMLRNRTRVLFKALGDCGLTIAAARYAVRAIATDAKTRPGSYLLGIVIFGAFVLFAEYIMLGMVALVTLAALLSAIGRWRGFERLARNANVALFLDECRGTPRDGAKAAG